MSTTIANPPTHASCTPAAPARRGRLRPRLGDAQSAIASDRHRLIPAMGPANRAPGIPIMGWPDPTDHLNAMGAPDAGLYR